MERLAASVALRMASGTSRALPCPKPTRPFWSPTTPSAAKPKRRPPFTTLATRLMCTSLSTNSLSRSSRWRSRAIVFFRSRSGRARKFLSEVQAALARRVGKRLDPAVKQIGTAVEHHIPDPLGERTLGNERADRLGGGNVGARLEVVAHGFFERRGGRDRLALGVVDHLRIDVLGGAVNREPQPVSPR